MLNKLSSNHAICNSQKELRKQDIINSFGGWLDDTTFNDWHFSLYKFASIRPLKYFDSESVDISLSFFEKHPEITIEAITDLDVELSHAIFSLLRESDSWHNEKPLSLD